MSDTPAPLADTHCHLTLPQFEADLEQVLERARHEGVVRMLVPGIDPESSRQAVRLAEARPGLYAAVGVHPHRASLWGPAVRGELRNLAGSGHVRAIGEIGLDFYRDWSPRDRQQDAFRAQLDLAGELGLPVIVHQREAAPQVLQVLREWVSSLPASCDRPPGVLHAFSGPPAFAAEAASLGFYLGLAGPITYTRSASLRSVAASTSLERLLLETDAPYLPPQARRGKRNEPAYLRQIAECLSEVRNLPYPLLARTTAANASRLFGWNHVHNHRDIH